MVIMGCGPDNITIDHNTVDTDGTSAIQFYAGYAPFGYQIEGFVLKNNLLRDNKYGIFGDNSSEGVPSLTKYTPNAYVQANSIGGAQASIYPTGNDYPTLAQWLADFVDRSAVNYQLVSSSISNNAGTDGKDIGVDFAELNAALSGSSSPTPPPPSSSGGGTTPYSGTPVSLPGKVQFENYDVGGKDVAYHDTTAGNTGGAYRANSVDIQATSDSGGGYNIGWVKAGEWLKYTVKVGAAGTYALDVRVAQETSGGTFHVEVDEVNATGTLAVPNTGGWQAWQPITTPGIALTAGPHVVRVAFDSNGGTGWWGNLNSLRWTAGGAPPPASPPYGGNAAANPGGREAEEFEQGGEGGA
jgi:hypothetical protein